MTDKTSAAYGSLSRLNHWLGALVFSGMIIVGFILSYDVLSRETAGPIRDLHKATGTLVLLFALWRVSWRLVQGFPPPVPGVPAWQELASRLVHWGMLAALLIMPLSGVLMSLIGGRPIDIYGLFLIPPFAENREAAGLLRQVHGYAAYALAGLIALHILAALKHALIDKDGTLARMLSGKPATVQAS